jgi:hypothetical protein
VTDGGASYYADLRAAFVAVLELHGVECVRQRGNALVQLLYVSARVIYGTVHRRGGWEHSVWRCLSTLSVYTLLFRKFHTRKTKNAERSGICMCVSSTHAI